MPLNPRIHPVNCGLFTLKSYGVVEEYPTTFVFSIIISESVTDVEDIDTIVDDLFKDGILNGLPTYKDVFIPDT